MIKYSYAEGVSKKEEHLLAVRMECTKTMIANLTTYRIPYQSSCV